MKRRTPTRWAGVCCLFVTMLLWFTACTQPEATPFPTPVAEAPPSEEGVPEEEVSQEEERQSFESPGGLFRIEIPTSWAVEERGPTSLGLQYAIGPEPLGPGPETSFIYVAGADVSPEAAAEQLLCGSGCADEIELDETTVAGRPAFRALLGESPQLEWYFVPHGDRLIFFSIHDASTFATREDLLETLVLEEAGTPEPTVTPTPSPTETPTPMPEVTVEAVREWQVVTVEEAGLTFEVPAQWNEAGEYRWVPEDTPELSLGLQWAQHGPAAEPASILPADVELLDSEPMSITWGSRISATVQADAGLLQRHLITQVGLRTYDFYSEAPSAQALNALDPVLQEIVNSMVITERLLFHDDPVDAGIEFFRELLRDPASAATHSYLSSELLAQLDENPDATALLNLPQPFHTFNLDWVTGSEEQAILEATLTLADDSTVVRNVHLSFDVATGWRIDGFEEAERPAGEGTEGEGAEGDGAETEGEE